MKQTTISEIITYLHTANFNAQYCGDEKVFITSFSNISDLQDNTIAWIKNKKYLTEDVISALKQHQSVIIVCPWKIEEISNCIVTDSPKGVFFSILNKFFKERKCKGISGRAIVETDKIGNNVTIGPGCYICHDVEIADDVILHANVVIDCPCKIGKGTEIFAGVVIGSDGFGYYHHDDIPQRVPHFGGVIIGNNVDIGANTTIDRGTLEDTIIDDNVKIDNLCQIGHNVHIQNNSFIIAGTILCGSVKIGKNSYVAPGAVIKNQVIMGDNCFLGMNSVLNKNLESFSMAVDFSQSIAILEKKDYRTII